MDTQALLAAAMKKAQARAAAAVETQEKRATEKATNEARTKAETWQNELNVRAQAERDARDKAGMEIAENFIAEIAEPFQRFANRADAAKKISNLEIILRPGKSDLSASYSIQLRCSGSSPKVWHRASLENMSHALNIQLDRLRKNGGVVSTSPMEMSQEILRLRDTIQKISSIIQNAAGDEANKVKDVISTLDLSKEAC